MGVLYGNLKIWLFVSIFPVFFLPIEAFSIENPSSEKDEYVIDHFTWVEFEEDGLQSPKIIKKFQNISFIDIGVQTDTVYFLVELSDLIDSALKEGLIMEINSPSIRSVEIFEMDIDGEYALVDKKGIAVDYKEFDGEMNPVFEINEPVKSQFLVKVFSSEPISFGISVYPKKKFYKRSVLKAMFVNIYIGIMMSLFLYNLVLYFSIRDKVYLIYCCYTLFITLAQLSLLGFTFQFILNFDYTLYEKSIIFFSCLSGIFAVLFVRTFLKTRQLIPKLDKVLIFIGILYFCIIFIRLFALIEISYALTDIAGLLVAIFFFASGVVTAIKGYRPAIYFLIAWSFFLLGVVFFVLRNQGIGPFQSLNNFPMLIGTAVEAILLSLALADRINMLKKEKEEEQHKKLDALKENERLIREQNITLEEKVKLRTEELEQTLKHLQNTQTQLVNQEKMASLGQLTAGIAHEINNPINFVSSNISPLKRDLKDIMEVMDAYREKGSLEFSDPSKKELADLEEELEYDYLVEEVEMLLRGMEDGAKRTVEIVKGLRLFSRVDEQDVKKVDIHDGINSTLILLNSAMGGRIEVKREFGELPMVECLAGKINQVFMNIISNSVQALLDHPDKNKTPQILIKTFSEGEDVYIEITDNGPGMPAHIRERIFEPFFTTKAVGKGTGLGLSIVYTIIENHQGHLEVVSEENKGTTFIIKLPIYQKSTAS